MNIFYNYLNINGLLMLGGRLARPARPRRPGYIY